MNLFFYIYGTLFFTVYGQIILKSRLSQFESLSGTFNEKIFFLVKALLDPYILSGFVAAFAASLCWIATMPHFDITKAYPFISLTPALVFVIGILFLEETFTIGKLIGLLLILLGIIVTVKF